MTKNSNRCICIFLFTKITTFLGTAQKFLVLSPKSFSVKYDRLSVVCLKAFYLVCFFLNYKKIYTWIKIEFSMLICAETR